MPALGHGYVIGMTPTTPLPDGVADLLRELAAPPRLVAHLIVVHDVACLLTDPGTRLRFGDDLLAAAGRVA